MASAGYVLVDRELEWQRIGTNGDVRIIESSDLDQPTYLPSPDGGTLARVRRDDCTSSEAGTDCTYHVSFVDANSLEPVGTAVEHRLHDRYGRLDRLSWSPDGDDVYVGSHTDAFKVSVEGRVETDVEPPSCSQGTSSSRVSADGRLVEADVVDGDIDLTITPVDGPGWPDRCFPPAE